MSIEIDFTVQESCVIVGRCADYILKEHEHSFHVFIYGDWKDRIHRVVQEHGVDPAAALNHVRERDKKRAKYYKHITDRVWGRRKTTICA